MIFASKNCLELNSLSRRDDLESLGLTMLYIYYTIALNQEGLPYLKEIEIPSNFNFLFQPQKQ